MKWLPLIAGTTLSVLAWQISVSADQRILYTESFSQSETSLSDLGFESIHYWLRDDSLGVMKTATPGGWGALAQVNTAPVNVDRSTADVRIDWKVRFPTTNSGPGWRENNKIWATVLDGNGNRAYEFLFKPNREQDRYTSFDMELRKFINGQATVLNQGFSHKLTPSGQSAKPVSFCWVFGTDGGISVQYDAADGDGLVEYISVTDTEHEMFSKLRFTYKTGTGSGNYHVEVDNIQVRGESPAPPDEDGDGIPDAVECVLGSDPHSGADAPVVAVPSSWEVCPDAPTNLRYDYSGISGYGSRAALKVSVPAGVLADNLAPIVTVADPTEYNGENPTVPEDFEVIGSVLSVHASLRQGAMLPTALALPDNIPNAVAARFFRLYHYIDDAWREEPLRNVTDGALHFVSNSFSPFVVAAKMSGVIHVDGSVEASGDGTTWVQAKKTLVEGLQAASAGQEIWVAEGTYYPTLTPATETDRSKRFQLAQDQRIVGGFPAGGTTLQARNVSPCETILSGDIGVPGDIADNCYNVLLVGWATGVTVEGVTIEGANSVGSAYSLAGGLYATGAQVTVRNCLFRNNRSGEGAGIGMYEYSEVTVEDCRFVDNSANYGGALCSHIAGTPLTVSRCHFYRNTAAVDGGGLYVANGTSTVINSVFSMNTAGRHGGGTYYHGRQGWRHMVNCTFYGNSAEKGGGVYNGYGDEDDSDRMELYNTILWANSSSVSGDQVYNSTNALDVKSCNIEDGSDGIDNDGGRLSYDSSNKNANPQFVQVPSATDEGNLYLLPGSPCIEAGDPVLGPEQDVDGNRRFRKKLVVTNNMPSETPKGVNIGAYEDNRFGMALIPPGTFYRGQAHAVSSDPTDDERPVKLIAVSKPFWMDKVEVTQESFHELMGYNAAERGSGIGSGYGWHGLSLGADLPVTRVDWLEAALYCNERTKAEALANPDGELTIADTVYKYTEMIELDKDVYGNDHSSTRFRTPVDFHTDYSAKGYRLPTEAEWEFAARGAAKTRYSWGELFVDAQDLDQRPGYEYSWGKDATRLEFHAIGRKAPNSLGLFDLLSNAGEWCNDWYLEDYYHVSAVSQDPRGPDDSNYFTHEAPVWTETSAPWTAPKVVRGAAANTVGWSTPFEYYFRSAHRFSYGIYDMHVHGACFTFVGFRCVRVYQGNQSTWPAAIHVAEEIVPDSYDAGPGAPGANIENLTAIPDRVAVAENLTVRWRNNTPTPDVTVQLTKDGGRSWVEISEGAINSPRGDYMQWDYIIPQSLVGETCMIRLAVYGGNIFSAPTGVFEVLAENP